MTGADAGAAPSSRDGVGRMAFGPTAAATVAAACEISGCSASCAFRSGRVRLGGPLALPSCNTNTQR